MALTDQVLMPGSDYQAICNATRTLTGKTETLKSGDISNELGTVLKQPETWIINEVPNFPSRDVHQRIPFIAAFYANGVNAHNYPYIIFRIYSTGRIYFQTVDGIRITAYMQEWKNPLHRRVSFLNSPSGNLLAWLTDNAVKITDDDDSYSYNVQESLDYTVNGSSSRYLYPTPPYDSLRKVIVKTKTVEQAVPSIYVNTTTGEITSTVTQTEAGWVKEGTKTATQQLDTQAAKTITPSSSAQIAVPAGKYTTGAVTIAEIPKSYIGPLAPSAGCADILANVSISVGTLSGINLSLSRRLSTDGNSNIANKVIKQGDEYVDETLVTVPTEQTTITPSWTVSSSSSSYGPTDGRLIRRVVVNKPSTLIPSNIKNGVEIGGIAGTYTGDDVFIKDVDTINATTRHGVITFTTSRLARYLCVRTSSNLYMASADISSISSWHSVFDIDLNITKRRSTYEYTWHLFRSDESDYDGAELTLYIIYS